MYSVDKNANVIYTDLVKKIKKNNGVKFNPQTFFRLFLLQEKGCWGTRKERNMRNIPKDKNLFMRKEPLKTEAVGHVRFNFHSRSLEAPHRQNRNKPT